MNNEILIDTAETCARAIMDAANGDEDKVQGMILAVVQSLAIDVFVETTDEVLVGLVRLNHENEEIDA